MTDTSVPLEKSRGCRMPIWELGAASFERYENTTFPRRYIFLEYAQISYKYLICIYVYITIQCGNAKHGQITGDFEISYIEAPYRVQFYIKMFDVMSWGPHKVLELVSQAMVEIFANFVAWVLNKFRIFPWKFASKKF